MKEQLIEFKTAKLAKEKGFDIKVETFYMGDSEDNFLHNAGKKDNWNNRKCIFNESELSDDYSAPTQSLLQKFIWEKYSIWVQSTPMFSSNECIGVSVTISSWKFPAIRIGYADFDVYEGLEEGLQEALKLIKNE
jgi:hypothetical protein